jgi:hypothetical protein
MVYYTPQELLTGRGGLILSERVRADPPRVLNEAEQPRGSWSRIGSGRTFKRGYTPAADLLRLVGRTKTNGYAQMRHLPFQKKSIFMDFMKRKTGRVS